MNIYIGIDTDMRNARYGNERDTVFMHFVCLEVLHRIRYTPLKPSHICRIPTYVLLLT